MQDPTAQLRSSLAAAAATARARRARALVPGLDSVLGVPVRPLEPAAWTRLSAIGSPFTTAAPAYEGDVRNFIWFCSPLFMPRRWWTVPTFAKWLALLPFNALLHRRRDVDWYCATVALAVAQIRGLVADALADAPSGEGGSPSPGPALEAQFIHFCAERYGWSPAYTRRQPLRLLWQLFATACPADDTSEERAAKIAHLTRRKAELEAQRQAAANGTPATGSST